MNSKAYSQLHISKRPFAGRLIFAVLMALAVFVQGYTTQTHIHRWASQSINQTASNQGKTSPDKYPANDDPANCPICQQILHAGQFVAPAWLLPFLVITSVSTVFVITSIGPHYDAVSHTWRGRGPPRH